MCGVEHSPHPLLLEHETQLSDSIFPTVAKPPPPTRPAVAAGSANLDCGRASSVWASGTRGENVDSVGLFRRILP